MIPVFTNPPPLTSRCRRFSVAVTCVALLSGLTTVASGQPPEPPAEKTVVQDGVSVTTRITDPSGKPVKPGERPVQIIRQPGVPGQPNRVQFRFERPDGTNIFAPQARRRGAGPSTMRQQRIGDYRTDGVLLAGDMWRSMEQWGVADLTGAMELATYQPKQTVEEFATAHNLTLRELQLLNPLAELESLQDDTPLCVRMTHRVLPGEDMAFLTDLYQTTAAVLTELNQLDAKESLTWKQLRVPAVAEMGRSGFAFYQVRYAPPAFETSLQRDGYQRKMHTVGNGEDWDRIAATYQTTTAMLRRLNGQPAGPLNAGDTIAVQSQMPLKKDLNRSFLVFELESRLGLDLDDVLALNELGSPAEIRDGQMLRLPIRKASK